MRMEMEIFAFTLNSLCIYKKLEASPTLTSSTKRSLFSIQPIIKETQTLKDTDNNLLYHVLFH